MKFDYILFDLDGTLTDPYLGITNSVLHALHHYGMDEERENLKSFIGPPLHRSFMDYCGFSEEKAFEAIDVYREHFSVKGLFENEIYEGIPELLAALKEAGSKVLLATSKPEVFALKILEHFDILQYFDAVGGSALDGSRVNKDDVVAYVLEKGEVSGRGVMVGDREFDVFGGKALNLETVGVLYGYGDLAELQNAGADFIAKDVAELKKILL